MSSTAAAGKAANLPWYRVPTRQQWSTLIASNLGWLFDGFETYGLILTAPLALRTLLPAELYPRIPAYVGLLIAITLLGWGVGGLLGGILADYVGRKRTMMIAIVSYSITTGLSALSFNLVSLLVLRFLVGVCIGSEWATGSSMVAEIWPARARGKGAGLMQCGLGMGFFLASFVWLWVAPMGPESWRTMYLIGVLPALLTIWIRRTIPESERWEAADAKRREAIARQKSATAPTTERDADLARFTLFDLFADKKRGMQTIAVFLLSLTTTVGFWGISTWVPPYISSVAVKAGLDGARWFSYAGMAYTIGSIIGYITLGFLADAFGRKPVTLIFVIMALVMTPPLFLYPHELSTLLILAGANAIFSNGQYTWLAVWGPELYPTRMRATALAFAFNAPRFVAFLGPLVAGTMIASLGGYGHAAMALASIYVLGIIVVFFLPETRGKPLPE